MIGVMDKKCGRCKVVKSTNEFQKNCCAKDGFQWQCKSCRKIIDSRDVKRAYDRRRYHEQKETAYLDPYYRRAYNITLNDYETLYAKQNGVCAICQELCVTGRRLAVDHCHYSNKVRGLLCSTCNQGLGMFKNNNLLLTKAIKYLENYGT